MDKFKPMTIAEMRHEEIIVATSGFCKEHQCYYVKRKKFGDEYTEPFCLDCAREKLEARKRQVSIDGLFESQLKKTAYVFKRESMISPELKTATLKTFEAKTEAEKAMLNFAYREVRDYLKGREGNCLLSGKPGTGKSHLAVGMARMINQSFKNYDEARSVIYMPLPSLFNKIKNSFDGRSFYTKEFATRLLTDCDFLVLDDLGHESAHGGKIKAMEPWAYQFLFELLDNRKSTVFTTNFSLKELKQIYDEALISRILKGTKENGKYSHILNVSENVESKR